MEDLVNFLHKVGELKDLERTGWKLHEVPNPESVADHSFRTAVMALILAKKLDLNTDKCVKMALIHDLSEVIAGDITPHDNINEEEKHKLEKQATKELIKDIDSDEVFELWLEFEEGKTPEAEFIYELDKIEMLLQTFEYEQKHKEEDIDLREFWEHVESRIKEPMIKKIFQI